VEDRDSELLVRIAGDIPPEQASEIEEAIWQKLHFASHLRSERLGQFVVGNDLQRSASLALVQLLILYHLVTAKAAIALGGVGPRARAEEAAEQETAGVNS
jgi:phosphoribulokinase